MFDNKMMQLFSGAKRVALLAFDNHSKKWYHIFSVVEFLPKDFPSYNIPTHEWFQNKTIRSKFSAQTETYSFSLVVEDLTIESALNCFNFPFQNGFISGEPLQYFNTHFLKEPSGNVPLVLRSNKYENNGIGAILPKRDCGFLAWSQIDSERIVERTFRREGISNDMKSMTDLTENWLGFDIWSKAEHLGNVYLALPNPYFRGFDVSLSQNPPGIFYNFKMRKGVKESLKIRVIDKHGDSIAIDKIYKIKEFVGLIQLPHEPHLVEFRVYNSSDDLIYIDGPSTFLKTVQVGLSLKQADFNVKVEDSNGVKEFSVEKFSREEPITIGKRVDFNAAYYFKNAERRRKHLLLEDNKEFVFFPGGKSVQEKSELKHKAKNLIRNIINTAKDVCFLCDPYFNVTDLIEYAFYIKNSGVKLKILNTKDFGFDKTKAQALLEAIEEYNKKPFQKIECRLLRGNSILHDRFIIADLNVWFLGSSFSEFGSRATCLGKVPESANTQIVKEIEKWYYSEIYSESIEDYVKNIG